MGLIGRVMLADKCEKNPRGVRHGNDPSKTSTTGVCDPSLSQRHWRNGLQRQRQTTRKMEYSTLPNKTTTLNQALRGPNDWEPLSDVLIICSQYVKCLRRLSIQIQDEDRL